MLALMTKFTPRLILNQKGLLSYELGADISLVFPLATKLQEKFGLEAGKMPAFGPDQLFVELVKGEKSILVGWDIWSDLFIMAGSEDSNDLLKEISMYLDSILDELEELEKKLIAEQKSQEKAPPPQDS